MGEISQERSHEIAWVLIESNLAINNDGSFASVVINLPVDFNFLAGSQFSIGGRTLADMIYIDPLEYVRAIFLKKLIY